MRPPHLPRASRTVTFVPARASSRAAIRPAAPAPMTMTCSGCRRVMVDLLTSYAGRRVLDPIPQQHDTSFKFLAALKRHRRDGGALTGLGVRGVEHARRAVCAVYDWTEGQVEFVHQSRTKKSAIGATSTFEQQALHAEFAIENVEHVGKVEL